MVKQLKAQGFVLYVALNMAVCAVFFAPWALPRETVSGLLGRWMATEAGLKRYVAGYLALAVDAIYFWEPNHCVEVFLIEMKAREVLYPPRPGVNP